LPLVVGEGANQQVTKIFTLLKKENALFEEVQAAVRVSGRRWNIVFANGIEVMLPENDLDEAWHKLARLNEEKQLLERAIKSVDLRVPDRIYIRTLNGQLVPDSAIGGSSA
jgi:cell division protein FtsQ